MRSQIQRATINEMVRDQGTQKISYKKLDIYQVVASFYNCGVYGNLRRAYLLNPEFSLATKHHFVTADMVRESLVETPLTPGPEGIEIRNLKIKGVARFIGIVVENAGDLIVNPYGIQYGQELPKKIITVLQFFQRKNNLSLDNSNVEAGFQLSGDAVNESRNNLYGRLFEMPRNQSSNTGNLSIDYQLNLYNDVTRLLWKNFSVDDVTFMSITPLYELAVALSAQKGGIYNKLNMVLRSLGKKMHLADPTPELEDRFRTLRKDITQLLKDYQKQKSLYEEKTGCALPCIRYS